jgi:2'-5' RNA ligase
MLKKGANSGMKLCIALLVDYRIHNYARKLALQLANQYGTGLRAALLPQHVTLTPVFEADELATVEEYFNQLALRLVPVELHFTQLELKLSDCSSSGVIWLKVAETPQLAEIKRQLTADIAQKNWRAELLCGEAFQLHSTVVMGKLAPETYQAIFAAISDKKLNLTCLAKELVLFCPAGETAEDNYLTYKIMPLGK